MFSKAGGAKFKIGEKRFLVWAEWHVYVGNDLKKKKTGTFPLEMGAYAGIQEMVGEDIVDESELFASQNWPNRKNLQ